METNTDLPDLADAASAHATQLQARIQGLEAQLSEEKDLREHFERLLKINPDTTLPIYREFLIDLDRIIHAYQSTQSQVPAFHVVIIRLDAGYQRIKNTKDRSKAILFRTTIRIREVVGEGLYQSERLDEFILLLKEEDPPLDLKKIFSSVIHEISLPQEGSAENLSFGCHIGFATFPGQGSRGQDLLNNAEIALRIAIQKRLPVVHYSERIGTAWNRTIKLEQELALASKKGFPDFFMVYQPFVTKDHRIKGSESLIRWNHPELGFIPPPHFIPLAERTGVIRMLGRWILYQSCQQLKLWHQAGFKDLFVSVNLSPAQFIQKDLLESIRGILDGTGVPGNCIKLEITEGVLMDDPEQVIKKLWALKDMGIRLSIDDFGTGYSSLNYLRKLPLSTLKIDKSFVDHVCEHDQDKAIIRAIISMSRGLGLETLAEGVETRDQRDFLLGEGCDYIQGYFYSKPVKPDIFDDYLAKGGVLPLDPTAG